MTRLARHEYAAALRARYLAAAKGEKGRLLDEFCRTTGSHRKAAIRLLRGPARKRAQRPGRPRRYGPELVPPVTELWELSDRPCAKLLAPLLPTLVAALERHGELRVAPEVQAQLLTLSPATLDRLLAPVRRRLGRQPRRVQPPGSTLKGQIPLRTFGEWDHVTPGSLQGDLVLHCGESTAGCSLSTLVAVDVATSWTELEAIWGVGQQRVGSGVHHVRQRLPFPLREWHTDNGSEFLNRLLLPWCKREGIRVTRGRGYRKNDQAWVEQKNWLAVRRLIGYDRYSSHAAQAIFQQLYPLLEQEMNFFRPLRKLVGKERVGAKIVKHYDTPRTPYERVLTTDTLSANERRALEQAFAAINPARLQAQIDELLERLWTCWDTAKRKVG